MTVLVRSAVLGISGVVAFGLGGVSVSTDAAAAWEPKKPVEFVIMAGKGGGADRLARFIQGIIKKEKLSRQAFVPINKGGGSGAEALRYLKDKKGDPHVILATLNSYYTTPLRNPSLGVDIAGFTPIGETEEYKLAQFLRIEMAPLSKVRQYLKLTDDLIGTVSR